jgi:hypothetical protein
MPELQEFVEKLGEAHGENLKSVVLYGASVAGGLLDDEQPKKVLVVLDRITPEELRNAHDVGEWWREAGNPPPVYFTREEIVDASDVFPIDFLDLAEVRHVVYGRDPFEGLDVSTANLRHQLEYELRGKLIRLRTLYVSVSRHPDRLARLMSRSLETFAELFRHVLRLLGEDAPLDLHEAAVKLARRLGLDEKVFNRIFEYGRDDELWLEAETNETFRRYLEDLDRIIEAVDHIG